MISHRLALRVLPGLYAICRLPPAAPVPDWATGAAFVSVTRTAAELSVVCPAKDVPAEVRQEGGWRVLEAVGPFDFNLTGVLNSLTTPLAEAEVPLFAVSTFDTDYLLVRDADLSRAVEALRGAGHTVGRRRERHASKRRRSSSSKSSRPPSLSACRTASLYCSDGSSHSAASGPGASIHFPTRRKAFARRLHNPDLWRSQSLIVSSARWRPSWSRSGCGSNSPEPGLIQKKDSGSSSSGLSKRR